MFVGYHFRVRKVFNFVLDRIFVRPDRILKPMESAPSRTVVSLTQRCPEKKQVSLQIRKLTKLFSPMWYRINRTVYRQENVMTMYL